jgi:hypothetical protein
MSELRWFGGSFEEMNPLSPISQNQVRTIPMLYRASIPFALEHAPTLQEFVDSVKSTWLPPHKYESLDVKIAMLKKGWWPCIPGWHLDDFYRPTGEQPDIKNLNEHLSTHFMTLYGDSSLTEFLSGETQLGLPPETGTVYGYYDKVIESSGLPKTVVKSETLYRFTSTDFHRGMPATKDGWRAFVRLTIGNERPPKDEIRTQVQVYVPFDKMFSGW